MKFNLIVITIVAIFSLIAPCSAADLIVEIGQNRYDVKPDGTWYQNGLPHDIEKSAIAYGLGASWKSDSGYRYSVIYYDFGALHSDAIAIFGDENYQPVPGDPCAIDSCTTGRFVFHGRTTGIAFSVGASHGIVYGEIGILASRSEWTAHVYQNGTTIVVSEPVEIEWTPKVAIGINLNESTQLLASYAVVNHDGGEALQSAVNMLSLRVLF